MLRKSLNRVFTAIIKADPGNESYLKSFNEAANGPSPSHEIEDNRYLFGSACEPRACFNQSGMVVDLKTGEVILRERNPSDELIIMSNDCTSKKFNHYAEDRLQDWAKMTSMRENGRITPLNEHDIEFKDCAE